MNLGTIGISTVLDELNMEKIMIVMIVTMEIELYCEQISVFGSLCFLFPFLEFEYKSEKIDQNM